MTRISYLTVSACLALLVTALGCNDSSGLATDGGGAGQGGGAGSPGGAVGTSTGGATGAAGRGSGGAGGTGGGAAAGANGTGGTTGVGGSTGAAGAKGAAGTTGAAGAKGAAGATGAAGVSGAAGTPGAAGATGAAGVSGAAGTPGAAGATGAAGAKGAAGSGGGLICQADQACTVRQDCQTACSGGADSHSTFCTCADQGGGGLTLACISLPCGGRDGGVNDGGPIFHACRADLKDGDNCDPAADTLCQSVCAADTQMRCLCAPHGGGGGGKWACTTGIACL